MHFYSAAGYFQASQCPDRCEGTSTERYVLSNICVHVGHERLELTTCFLLEALVLLIALTPASEELQKLVAFENAFEILFSLIEAEGALTHGTEVVEDCLSLLAHLLRFNVSNQSFFRETGCVKRVTQLLHECQQEPEGNEPAPQWTLVHRDKNVWGLLAIIQLFLIRGGMSTPINQTAFWQNGVTEQVLSIAFGQRFSVSVTSKVRCYYYSSLPGHLPNKYRPYQLVPI